MNIIIEDADNLVSKMSHIKSYSKEYNYVIQAKRARLLAEGMLKIMEMGCHACVPTQWFFDLANKTLQDAEYLEEDGGK